VRHGGRHDIWSDDEREVAVPRHNEINEYVADKRKMFRTGSVGDTFFSPGILLWLRNPAVHNGNINEDSLKECNGEGICFAA